MCVLCRGAYCSSTALNPTIRQFWNLCQKINSFRDLLFVMTSTLLPKRRQVQRRQNPTCFKLTPTCADAANATFKNRSTHQACLIPPMTLGSDSQPLSGSFFQEGMQLKEDEVYLQMGIEVYATFPMTLVLEYLRWERFLLTLWSHAKVEFGIYDLYRMLYTAHVTLQVVVVSVRLSQSARC